MKRYDCRYDDIGMEEYSDGRWVPADVARELESALRYMVEAYQTEHIGGVDTHAVFVGKSALAAADGEESGQ